jgi:hypothetical protein
MHLARFLRMLLRLADEFGVAVLLTNQAIDFFSFLPADLHEQQKLRAILNFTPGPQGISSPVGVNLAPRGEVYPFVHPQG